MEQDIRQTLHDVVERTRSKALNALAGILACCRVSNQTHALSSWEIQQAQLRVHVCQLQHSCRTLLSMACDLGVSMTLYDSTQRKKRFDEERAATTQFLTKLRDLYFTTPPPVPPPLPRATVVSALSRIVLPFCCEGLAEDRQEQLANAVVNASTFIPRRELPPEEAELQHHPTDVLTTRFVPPGPSSANLANAAEAVQWLVNDQKQIEVVRWPIDTMHSRLMLHP